MLAGNPDNREAAEKSIQKAIQIARTLGIKLFEKRADLTLKEMKPEH